MFVDGQTIAVNTKSDRKFRHTRSGALQSLLWIGAWIWSTKRARLSTSKRLLVIHGGAKLRSSSNNSSGPLRTAIRQGEFFKRRFQNRASKIFMKLINYSSIYETIYKSARNEKLRGRRVFIAPKLKRTRRETTSAKVREKRKRKKDSESFATEKPLRRTPTDSPLLYFFPPLDLKSSHPSTGPLFRPR